LRFKTQTTSEGDTCMNLHKCLAIVLFTLMFLGGAAGGGEALAQSAEAQSPATGPQIQKQEDETNLDTQLYLLVATNQDVDDAKLPSALDPVVKQLRSSLPFKNYRLAA